MIKQIIAIYPGRFQPFGPHHNKAFEWLRSKFGTANTYIVTSNVTEPGRSPLSFAEKRMIMQQYGIPKTKIIQSKSPYKAEELMSSYDPKTTAVVFMVGEKDMKEDPRFRIGVKKDGSPGYFQKYSGDHKKMAGFDKHGYLVVAPHVNIQIPGAGEMSGTALRKFIPTSSAQDFKKLFGWYDSQLHDLLAKRFGIKEHLAEENFTPDLAPKKNNWYVFDPDEIVKVSDNVIDLVQTAYKNTSDGSFVNSLNDIKKSTVWEAIDWDEYPDADAVIFGRKSHAGIKIQGIGHDGESKSKEIVLDRLVRLLNKQGYWIEASGALEKVLYRRNVEYVKTAEDVQQLFPKSQIEMLGQEGKYTRTLESGKEVQETSFGKPNIDLSEAFWNRRRELIPELEAIASLPELRKWKTFMDWQRDPEVLKVWDTITSLVSAGGRARRLNQYDAKNNYPVANIDDPDKLLNNAAHGIHTFLKSLGIHVLTRSIPGSVEAKIRAYDRHRRKPRNYGGYPTAAALFKAAAGATSGVPSIDETFLTEGGAFGHLSHPWDDSSLTFKDLEELIVRALKGKLDVEGDVQEKTDGQNLMVTYKNGQLGAARNKSTVLNPMSTDEVANKFAGRGDIETAFVNAMVDLEQALEVIPQAKLKAIFKNGLRFLNLEVIFPGTKNVIDYGGSAFLILNGLVEFDEAGKPVKNYTKEASQLQGLIQKVNAHQQRTYSIIAPKALKLAKSNNLSSKIPEYKAQLNQIANRIGLTKSNTLGDYYEHVLGNIIDDRFDVTPDVKDALLNRWVHDDKTFRINVKTVGDQYEDLAQFEANELPNVLNELRWPIESLFLKLGSDVMSNISDFLSLSPDKTVQAIRQELEDIIAQVKTTKDYALLAKFTKNLEKLKAIGGFEKIVPAEGIVFNYKGRLIKLTGAFAPINQLLGTFRYSK